MLVQTLVAFAAVVVLGLILKLLFGRRRDTTTVTRPPTEPDDFGLLSPAAVLDFAEDAYAFRRLLEQAGIRATTTIARDGRYLVLVFQSELDRARRVGGIT
jgi:hypothetical protein